MRTSTYFRLFWLSIVIHCLAANMLYAQALQGQPLIDSLLKELPKAKEDTLKIKILLKLSVALSPNDSKAALDYATQCMNLSKKINWAKGIGYAYFALARAYYEISDYPNSLEKSTKAYEIFKSLNDKVKMAAALELIANNYDESGYYAKSIETNFTALRLYEELNNKEGISDIYNNVGADYYHLSEYDKAIDSYNKSLTAGKESRDQYGIASTIDNIASVFLDQGKYDSANIYNLRAIKIFEQINHQPALGRIYVNRGNLMLKEYDAKSAYEFYNRSIAIDKKLGIKRELATGYGGMGELFLILSKDSTGKYIVSPSFNTAKKDLLKKSKYYMAEALSLSKEVGDIALIAEYASYASETEERLGDYNKALSFHKEYALYKDSIFNDENRKKLAAMENERLAEVKDNQIKLLTQQRALESSEARRQSLIKNIILISAGAAAVLSFLFIWLYNRRRKAAFEKLVMQVEMKALRAQMNPHFIFNSLHSINKYVIENDKEKASAYLSKFANLMRMILENSREQEISLEKDLLALELYMQLESLRFQNKFQYIIETDPGIDVENTLVPPLLLQPFAENAIIHGVQNTESGLIKIRVSKENNMIRCIVEDNGMGRENPVAIMQAENKRSKSLALKIISERLNIINQLKKVKAAVKIFDLKDAENKPGGLRIELLLPLELAF